jgi:hypothetical protein
MWQVVDAFQLVLCSGLKQVLENSSMQALKNLASEINNDAPESQKDLLSENIVI